MSNGLQLKDISISDDDIQALADLYGNIQVNRMTIQEVKESFAKFQTDTAPALLKLGLDMKTALMVLGSFIYKNGMHEDLKDSLIVYKDSDDKNKVPITWKDFKTAINFKKGQKQLYVRYVVSVLKVCADSSFPDNILATHANKYNLQKELEEIPAGWRFFGAHFHPNIPQSDSNRVMAFSKKVITLSQGGAVTETGKKS